MKMRVYGISDVGQRRRNNEDAYLINRIEIFKDGKKRVFHVLAVADGMGGHEAGEVASGMAVDRLTAAPLTYLAGDIEGIRKIIEFVNKKVHERSQKMGKKMGTTLVAALIEENKGYIFNVGDSRAYLFRKGKLRQVTKDHSVVQELLDKGLITKEEAATHPDRHVITMAIGTKDHVAPDTYSVQFDKGDILLLCSDGVTDMVSDEELEEIITNNTRVSSIGGEIVKRANQNGGKDNITAVIAAF